MVYLHENSVERVYVAKFSDLNLFSVSEAEMRSFATKLVSVSTYYVMSNERLCDGEFYSTVNRNTKSSCETKGKKA